MTTQALQDPTLQYGRAFNLIVQNAKGQGLDLSQFRVKFSIKQTTYETPNAADIRIYNLAPETALQVKSEFKQVIIQGGYGSNFGVIFKGNIKQVIQGRESATDSFVDIVAGDGDLAYNYAIVNATLAAGSSVDDQVNTCVKSGALFGLAAGGNTGLSSAQKLPRGKVMFGMARNYLRDAAQTTQNQWSIQNGQVVFVPLNGYLPGTAPLITADTGMIGAPEQTNEGVNVKCLINPKIKIGGRIQIDNSTVQLLHVNLTLKPGSQTNTQAPLAQNGIYFVMALEHQGDTRGIEWYTKVIALYTKAGTVFLNSNGGVG